MANLLKRMHLAGLCLCAAFSLEAQVMMTQDGRPMARIVLASSEETNREAAELLQDFVGRGAASRGGVRPLDLDNIGEGE